MTTPPAIPPAAGRTAAKSQAKGKLAGQMAPREQSNRFEHVLAHADAPKRGAKAEPLSEMQAPPVRKSERLMRDHSTTHAARRGPEREQRELHSLVAVLGGAEEHSEVADVSEGERDVGSPVPPVPVSSPACPSQRCPRLT